MKKALALLLLVPAAYAADPVIEEITATTQTGLSGTTATINYPATVNADDLLILIVTSHPANAVDTWGDSFVELGDDSTSITNTGAAVAWLQAAGTESGTVSLTYSGTINAIAAQMYRICNWNTLENPVIRAIQSHGTTAAPDPSSWSSWGWGAGDNLFINMIWFADDAETVSAFPASFSDGTLDTTADGGANESAQVASAYLFDNVATSVNAEAWTLSGAEGVLSSYVAIEGGAASCTAGSIVPITTTIQRRRRQ